MKLEYLQILDLKKRFLGAKQGFDFLNSFLDEAKKLKNLKKNDLLSIYDYRDDIRYDLYVDYNDFYALIQKRYIDFLIKEKFFKYEWVINLRKAIYTLFDRNINKADIFSDVLIEIFIKAFVFLSNKNNEINFGVFSSVIVNHLITLSKNEIESKNYFQFIILHLKEKNLIVLENDFISINDRFIYHDFCVTSLHIPSFFSFNDFDIKYSCKYSFESVLNVIDYYLSSLVYDISYSQSKELFSLDPSYDVCFPFLMNYDDNNLTKIPALERPYQELFDAFFIKKLILNEYCFHTIILSCFDYYIYDNNIKNILMEKADPKLKFKSEYAAYTSNILIQ